MSSFVAPYIPLDTMLQYVGAAIMEEHAFFAKNKIRALCSHLMSDLFTLCTIPPNCNGFHGFAPITALQHPLIDC